MNDQVISVEQLFRTNPKDFMKVLQRFYYDVTSKFIVGLKRNINKSNIQFSDFMKGGKYTFSTPKGKSLMQFIGKDYFNSYFNKGLLPPILTVVVPIYFGNKKAPQEDFVEFKVQISIFFDTSHRTLERGGFCYSQKCELKITGMALTAKGKSKEIIFESNPGKFAIQKALDELADHDKLSGSSFWETKYYGLQFFSGQSDQLAFRLRGTIEYLQ